MRRTLLVISLMIFLVGCTTPAAPTSTTLGYERATYIGRWANLTTPNACKAVLSGGNRVRLTFTGTSLALSLWVPPRTYPTEIEYRVDGGEWQRSTISDGMVLASGLASRTHTCEVWLSGTYFADSRWTNHYGLAIKGFTVDSGRTTSPWPTGNVGKMLTIGDSIAEGEFILGGTSNLPQYGSGRTTFPSLLAASLGYDSYNFSFGGAGMTQTRAGAGVPGLEAAFPYAMSGVAATDPEYDVVLIEAINNDGSDSPAAFRIAYTSLVNQVKAAWPSATIYCMGDLTRPSTGREADVRYVCRKTGATFVDTSAWRFTAPNLGHPDQAGHTAIARYLEAIVRPVRR